MYDNKYEEEIIRRWEQEGGKFLLENAIVIDTPDSEEVRKFKREIGREEIEKTEGRRPFNVLKLNERSDKKMDYEFDDSAYNDTDDLKNLIENFIDEELDDGEFEKAKKKMPPKLVEGLEEAFKILNEHKDYLDEDLKNAMQYIARILTKYPEPGKLPAKYPYPKKVQKSAKSWESVQDMLFGGHIGPTDDEEIEKSSKSNPFPSIVRGLKIKEEAINELEDEMEEDAFDPDDRRI